MSRHLSYAKHNRKGVSLNGPGNAGLRKLQMMRSGHSMVNTLATGKSSAAGLNTSKTLQLMIMSLSIIQTHLIPMVGRTPSIVLAFCLILERATFSILMSFPLMSDIFELEV